MPSKWWGRITWSPRIIRLWSKKKNKTMIVFQGIRRINLLRERLDLCKKGKPHFTWTSLRSSHNLLNKFKFPNRSAEALPKTVWAAWLTRTGRHQKPNSTLPRDRLFVISHRVQQCHKMNLVHKYKQNTPPTWTTRRPWILSNRYPYL